MREDWWAVIKILAIIFFVIALLFVFWGGYPEGIFNKVDRIEQELNTQFEAIKFTADKDRMEFFELKQRLEKLEQKKWHR